MRKNDGVPRATGHRGVHGVIMRKILVRAGVLVAIALVRAAVASPSDARAQTAQEGESPDDAAVRALWSTLDASWNQRDAERFSDLFTADASFEFVDRGQSLESRATIHGHFAERFPRFAPDLRHHTSVRVVRDIAPDVRTVDGRVEILRDGASASAAPEVLRTFATFAVMLRTAEGWRIRALRVYELPEASGGGADR